MKKIFIILCFYIFLFSNFSCQNDVQMPQEKQMADLYEIQLIDEQINICVGGEINIGAIVKKNGNVVEGENLIFLSENSDVISVNKDGQLSCNRISNETCEVVCILERDKNITAKCNVIIEKKIELKVDRIIDVIVSKDVDNVQLIFSNSNVDNYEISDPDLAEINNGNLSFKQSKQSGSYFTITGKLDNGRSAKANIIIDKIIDVEEIQIPYDEINLPKYENKFVLNYKVLPENATFKNVELISSDIDKIIPHQDGTLSIDNISNDFSGNVTIMSKNGVYKTFKINVLDDYDYPYVSFSSKNSFTLTSGTIGEKTWRGKLLYTQTPNDHTSWREWDGKTIQANILSEDEDYLICLRGSGGDYHFSDPYSTNFIFNGGRVDIDGDIRSLIDYYSISSTECLVFKGLFSGFEVNLHPSSLAYISFGAADRYEYSVYNGPHKIGNVSKKFLPFLTLAPHCYEEMFAYGSLLSGPDLPATNLADYCYQGMFCGTPIKKAPELPATKLFKSCYRYMFSGCYELEESSNICAEILEEYCCERMYSECVRLKRAHTPSSNTLVKSCYKQMFNRCISLELPPNLLAMNLAIDCYVDMFEGCYNLKSAPDLPAPILASGCYSGMFDECRSLQIPPSLPAKKSANDCYRSMFRNCISLIKVPYLPFEELETRCCGSMFEGCKNLAFSQKRIGSYVNEFKIGRCLDTYYHTGVNDMFKGTSGSYQEDPEFDTIYYTSNEIIYPDSLSDL